MDPGRDQCPPGPARQRDPRIGDLLRSRGRREGDARDYRSIRRYLAHIEPVLTTWTAAGVTTLRKITTDHIEAVVSGLSGRERQQVAVSLRSLFKALKRERMVLGIRLANCRSATSQASRSPCVVTSWPD